MIACFFTLPCGVSWHFFHCQFKAPSGYGLVTAPLSLSALSKGTRKALSHHLCSSRIPHLTLLQYQLTIEVSPSLILSRPFQKRHQQWASDLLCSITISGYHMKKSIGQPVPRTSKCRFLMRLLCRARFFR